MNPNASHDGRNATTIGDASLESMAAAPPAPPPPNIAILQSLQAQVDSLQESNFDLQATMATMQAEQEYTYLQKEKQWQEHLSKLQCQLRLEQQTIQRLLQQQQQQQNQPQPQNGNPKRARVLGASSAASLHAFQKRLPARASIGAMDEDDPAGNHAGVFTSPGPPPEISLQRPSRQSIETATTAETTPCSPPMTSPGVAGEFAIPATDTPATGVSGATWLARQLLHDNVVVMDVDSSSSSTVSEVEAIRHVLIWIATTTTAAWTEAQLVEFLLQQPPSLSIQYFWQRALTLSRAGRRGILQAMALLEQDAEAIPKPSKASRIRRLNPDGTAGPELQDTRQMQRRQIWYQPGKIYPLQQEQVESSAVMAVDVVQDWINHRLETYNAKHLQLLVMVLEDCPLNSTKIWWTTVFSGVALELLPLHAKYTTTATTATTTKRHHKHKKASSSPRGTVVGGHHHHHRHRSKHHGRPSSGSNHSVGTDLEGPGGSFQRRLRFTHSHHDTNDSTHSNNDDLLLACLTLLERLVAATKLDFLKEQWYFWDTTSDNGVTTITPTPRQPYMFESPDKATEESALFWIGIVLDILEGVNQSYFLERGDHNANSGPKSLEWLPIWYPQVIALLMTIGRTTWGMTALCTRLPDSNGGECLPNALEVGIMHLFYLSCMDDNADDENTEDSLWQENLSSLHRQQQRRVAMDAWVRLWQQVLLFVQGQHTNENYDEASPIQNAPKTIISFRSLVLDLQDYYTSACTRILSDPDMKPEIHAMVRQQLEELALDEEEHDDWKETE